LQQPSEKTGWLGLTAVMKISLDAYISYFSVMPAATFIITTLDSIHLNMV